MKKKLENIKLAMFDFDDTLAFHKDRDYRGHRKNDNSYFIEAYKYPEEFYEKIQPCVAPESMKNLVEYLRKNNIPMYCVSGMRFSIHFKAKEKFVHKHYGKDIKLISASSQERKIDVVDILKQIHQCSNENILFVDDNEKIIDKMKDIGIFAITPDDVKNISIS